MTGSKKSGGKEKKFVFSTGKPLPQFDFTNALNPPTFSFPSQPFSFPPSQPFSFPSSPQPFSPTTLPTADDTTTSKTTPAAKNTFVKAATFSAATPTDDASASTDHEDSAAEPLPASNTTCTTDKDTSTKPATPATPAADTEDFSATVSAEDPSAQTDSSIAPTANETTPDGIDRLAPEPADTHPPVGPLAVVLADSAVSTVPSRKCHEEYYISDGNVTLLVENTLFRLHRSILAKYSPVFSGMRPSAEGSSDDTPISLPDVTVPDFERFLWMLYPPVIGANKARTIEEWTSILKQAHRWQTPDIKQLAATRLHRIPMDPVEKIALWRRCSLHNSGYLFGSYLAICQRPESLSLEEARLLGIETFVKVAGVRDRIRKEECEARLRRVSGPKLGKMQEAEAEEEEKRRVEKMVREVFGLHT